MNLYSVLEPILLDVIDVISPLQADWEARLNTISELRDVVESVESLRGNFFCILIILLFPLLYQVVNVYLMFEEYVDNDAYLFI